MKRIFVAAALAVGFVLGAPAAAQQAAAQLQAQTPAQLLAQVNAIPWTNGQRLVTGSTLQTQYLSIINTINAMGTWSGGTYAPPAPTFAQLVAGLGYTPFSAAGGIVSGPLYQSAASGCSPTSGNFDPNGSFSWVLTCSLTGFDYTGAGLPTLPVNGTHSLQTSPPYVNPDVAGAGRAQQLIQDVASFPNNSEIAEFINFDVPSMAKTGTNPNTQKTAFEVSARAHPALGQSKPISLWGANVDVRCEDPNGVVGNSSICYGMEIDHNMYNSGVTSAYTLWLAPSLGFTSTAGLYHAVQSSDSFSGVATISGATVTATTPDARGFSANSTGSITLGGVIYNVQTVIDATHLTIFTPKQGLPASATGVAYTWFPSAYVWMDFGTASPATRLATNADYQTTDYAVSGFSCGQGGQHEICFNASGDAGPNAFLSATGQNWCMGGLNAACMRSNDGTTITSLGPFTSGGLLLASASETVTGALTVQAATNYQVQISYNNSSGNGYGIIQSAFAGTANTPLQLNPNGGQVQFGAGIVAAALPTTGGTVKGTVCIDTAGNFYAKISTGACL